MPKVVLVHDWLNNKVGGAERVLFEFAKLYPEAPIYTMVYNPAKFSQLIDPNRVHTSYLQRLPRALLNHPRYLLPLIPSAIKGLRIPDCDILLTSSSAFMKNIKPPPGATHICYCHSPMRFAYDYREQYMQEQSVGGLQAKMGSLLRDRIRNWDQRHIKSIDVWLANSQTVAQRIEKFYKAKAQVIYPPVDTNPPSGAVKKGDYYITLSALAPYKKLDIVVEAARQADLSLVILGEGLDKARLQKLAGPKTRFPGYVSEVKKRRLLAGAKALIFPSEEDFGIAPIEAMAYGVPVVAYRKGGLTETVVANKTGVFFDDQTPASLLKAIKKFETTKFIKSDLTKQAQKFRSSIFRQQIRDLVNQHV